MRFAKPPAQALRSTVSHSVFGSSLGRTVLLSTAACLLAGAAVAGATHSYDSPGRIISVRYDDGKQIVYRNGAAGNSTQHVVSATTVNRKPVADPVTLTEDQNAVCNGVYGTGALSGGNTTVTYSSTHKRNATDRVVYAITDGQGMDATGEATVTLANLNPHGVLTIANGGTITHNNVCLTTLQVGPITHTISDGLGGTATGTINSTVNCEVQN